MRWLTNTKGKPDSMLTLGVVSLVVVLVKFSLSEVSVGPVVFGQLDSGVIAAILGSTLGAYVARRYTEANCTKIEETLKDNESK